MFYEFLETNNTSIKEFLEDDLNNNENMTLIERLAFYIINLSQKEKQLNKIKKINTQNNLTESLKQSSNITTQATIDKEVNDELETFKEIESKEGIFGSGLNETKIEKNQTAKSLKINNHKHTNLINSVEINNEIYKNNNTNEYSTTKKYEESNITFGDNNFDKILNATNKTITVRPIQDNQQINNNKTKTLINETSHNNKNTETTKPADVIVTDKITIDSATTIENITKEQKIIDENNINESSNPTHDLIAALVEMQKQINSLGVLNSTIKDEFYELANNTIQTNEVKYLKKKL